MTKFGCDPVSHSARITPTNFSPIYTFTLIVGNIGVNNALFTEEASHCSSVCDVELESTSLCLDFTTFFFALRVTVAPDALEVAVCLFLGSS